MQTSDWVVTAIDEPFYPALVALHNSIRANSSCTRLACLTYGTDELAEKVDRLGVTVHHNLDINAYLPPGEGTEEGCKPMYARLLVPSLYDRCAWFDADQVVLGNLRGLFDMKFSEPVAAVKSTPISVTVKGIEAPEGDSIYSGLMLFNVEAWKAQHITERCIELMNTPGPVWRFVVQSVLSYVLAGNFKRLSDTWQGFANRQTFRLNGHRVLHWHGRKMKPWTHPDMPNAAIWESYFCKSS